MYIYTCDHPGARGPYLFQLCNSAPKPLIAEALQNTHIYTKNNHLNIYENNHHTTFDPMAPTKPLAALLCAAALVAAAGVAPAGAALLCKDETIQLQMEVDGCNSVTLAKASPPPRRAAPAAFLCGRACPAGFLGRRALAAEFGTPLFGAPAFAPRGPRRLLLGTAPRPCGGTARGALRASSCESAPSQALPATNAPRRPKPGRVHGTPPPTTHAVRCYPRNRAVRRHPCAPHAPLAPSPAHPRPAPHHSLTRRILSIVASSATARPHSSHPRTAPYHTTPHPVTASLTHPQESIVATSAPTNGSLTQITWSGAQPQVEQAGPVTSYVFLGGEARM